MTEAIVLVDLIVLVDVIDAVMVAALGNGTDTVALIDAVDGAACTQSDC